MVPFLEMFFTAVAAQVVSGSSTSAGAYCTYADQGLQAFTSSSLSRRRFRCSCRLLVDQVCSKSWFPTMAVSREKLMPPARTI